MAMTLRLADDETEALRRRAELERRSMNLPHLREIHKRIFGDIQAPTMAVGPAMVAE